MSVLKTSEVFKLKLKMSEKFVLLKLADCADDRGCNAFPSVLAIAASCGCTERTVRDALRRLEALGLLEVSARATNRRPTVYRVRPEKGTIDPWFLPKSPELGGEICPPGETPESEGQNLPPKASESEGRELPPSPAPEAVGGQTAHSRGATFAPDPSKRDPSKSKEPSGARAPRAHGSAEEGPGRPTAEAPVFDPQALLAEFDALHRAEFKGEKATITDGKDARQLGDLVRKHGLEVVRARMRLFFKITDDAWLAQRGYTVSMFRNVFARFSLLAGRVAPAVDPAAESELAEMDRARRDRAALLRELAGQVLALMGTEAIRRRCAVAERTLRARYPHLTLQPEAIQEAAIGDVLAEYATEARLRQALRELECVDGLDRPAVSA